MNLLINLQIFRTNQWFMSAKFFIGCSLIHWRCCVAQLTSFFIASKRELDLFCQLCRPGLSAPTLSSMYCSHHNNMTALFTKRASLRTPQYSRLYSEPSADYIQQEEQKKPNPGLFRAGWTGTAATTRQMQSENSLHSRTEMSCFHPHG